MSVIIHHTTSPVLSQQERELLADIKAAARYPVCRFELRGEEPGQPGCTVLDAVHLEQAQEAAEAVKERGALLQSLQEKGLIVLYYNLTSYVKGDYAIYRDSPLFEQLQQRAAQEKKRAFLKKGRAVLTVKGQYACRQ